MTGLRVRSLLFIVFFFATASFAQPYGQFDTRDIEQCLAEALQVDDSSRATAEQKDEKDDWRNQYDKEPL